MSILIIGSKGTLGSEFMRQLGSDAVGWDLEDIDVTKKEEMQKIINLHPDLIINCSAYNAVDKAETDKENAVRINKCGVCYLAKTAKELNTILVHYSTDFVFDGEGENGYKEDDKPNPQSVYAESKYLGEQLLQQNTDKFYLIRLTGLFGKSGAGKKSFVESRIDDSKIKDELVLVDDEFTSPTYAPDLVKRTLYIVNNSLPYGIYHGSSSGTCSWYEFTKKIFEISNIKTRVISISRDKLNRPAKRPKRAILLNTKLPPARHWEEALREYLSDYRQAALSIVTVNFNDKENILKQMVSVREGARGLNYEQIISDNGSTDGSINEIKKSFPDVKVIENGKNIGFGAANNRALPFARGEFVLFLNPDMIVFPDSLKKLVDWMRAHPEVGITSPKLVDKEGDFNEKSKPRRFPTVLDQSALLLKIPHIFPNTLNHYSYSDFNPNLEQEVDSVRGSFMLMRREIIQKLGWAFDPRYFIWFEDVDVCREVKKLGYKVTYTPIISCVDIVGQSFKKQSSRVKQRWFTESMLKYFEKWEPGYKSVCISALKPIGILMADIASVFKK